MSEVHGLDPDIKTSVGTGLNDIFDATHTRNHLLHVDGSELSDSHTEKEGLDRKLDPHLMPRNHNLHDGKIHGALAGPIMYVSHHNKDPPK